MKGGALAMSAIVLLVTTGAAPSGSPGGGFEIRHLRVRGERVAYAVWAPPTLDRAPQGPAIVFLHGSGECGTDGRKPTVEGIGPALRAHPERWPFVVILPQKPREDEEWEEREEIVFAALADAGRRWRIDPDRVALTGISQGGHGTWMIGGRHPERWSCLVPVCGYGRSSTGSRGWRLPVWAFQGAKDDVVDPRDSRRIVDEMRRRQEQEAGILHDDDPRAARLTVFPDLGHGCWNAAYGDSTLPDWILRWSRNPGLASAGSHR